VIWVEVTGTEGLGLVFTGQRSCVVAVGVHAGRARAGAARAHASTADQVMTLSRMMTEAYAGSGWLKNVSGSADRM
jgi:hypothetical protein